MADIQMENTKTSEYEVTKESNMRKSIVVALLCLLCIILLLLGLSRAKYRTPEMTGVVDYEPALFNTVLLGDITGAIKSGHQINNNAVDVSLDLKNTNLLGQGFVDENSTFKAINPGDSGDKFLLPFTITNGTTLASSTIDGNIAGTDIGYTLKIITTTNLPLKYTLIDKTVSPAKSMNLVRSGLPTYDPAIGYCQTYQIAVNENPGAENNSEETGTNLLHKMIYEPGKIAVNQYALQVEWPANTQAEKDLAYMKEIDIIEIRVEIQSLVTIKEDVTSVPGNATVAHGIIRLKRGNAEQTEGSVTGYTAATIPNENFYKLPASYDNKVYGRKTVRYSNFLRNSDATSENPFPAAVTVPDNARAYFYDFSVWNKAEEVKETITWDAQEKKYNINQADIHVSMNNATVSIAVPKGIEGRTYYLWYNGTLYTGESTGKFVTTKKTSKVTTSVDNGNGGSKKKVEYKETDANAYEIYEFKSGSDVLSLAAMSSSGDAEEDLKLIMIDTTGTQEYGKEDFKIYVHSKE